MSEASHQPKPIETDRISAEAAGGIVGGATGAIVGTVVAITFEGMKVNAGTTGYEETGSQTGAPPMAEADTAQGGTILGLGVVGIVAGIAIAKRFQNRQRSYPDAINADA